MIDHMIDMAFTVIIISGTLGMTFSLPMHPITRYLAMFCLSLYLLG